LAMAVVAQCCADLQSANPTRREQARTRRRVERLLADLAG
jgi:hypothetical protein